MPFDLKYNHKTPIIDPSSVWDGYTDIKICKGICVHCSRQKKVAGLSRGLLKVKVDYRILEIGSLWALPCPTI